MVSLTVPWVSAGEDKKARPRGMPKDVLMDKKGLVVRYLRKGSLITSASTSLPRISMATLVSGFL